MACVEIAVSIVALNVKAVLRSGFRDRRFISSNAWAQVYVKLSGEPVPLARLQECLERVIVGVSVALNLIDDPEIRKLGEVGAGLPVIFAFAACSTARLAGVGFC